MHQVLRDRSVSTAGGLLFDAHGNHFANELEGRDYVIGEMWKSKPLFCLAVNKVTSGRN